MSVFVMGLSHKTAPIELREHLTVPESRLASALNILRAQKSLKEAVILSTCNRLEVYGRPDDERPTTNDSLKDFFRELYDSPKVLNSLYRFDSEEAVHHLFRVAAGLDSMVVGETDVLGQVKAAYKFAHHHGATGKITNVLFQRALFVGKAVRNQTNISEGSSSVGSIAVQLAERIFGNLRDHRILLLGAGEMAEVTARHLLSQKAGQPVVLNRTPEKAQQVAAILNGSWGPLENLETELLNADIVICSTSSDRPLITRAVMEPIMKARRMRSLYFIDIAVPRNVEPDVHAIDNVYVYNIDDLQGLVEENLAQRKDQIGRASALVSEMANEFCQWLSGVISGNEKPLRHSRESSL